MLLILISFTMYLHVGLTHLIAAASRLAPRRLARAYDDYRPHDRPCVSLRLAVAVAPMLGLPHGKGRTRPLSCPSSRLPPLCTFMSD